MRLSIAVIGIAATLFLTTSLSAGGNVYRQRTVIRAGHHDGFPVLQQLGNVLLTNLVNGDSNTDNNTTENGSDSFLQARNSPDPSRYRSLLDQTIRMNQEMGVAFVDDGVTQTNNTQSTTPNFQSTSFRQAYPRYYTINPSFNKP